MKILFVFSTVDVGSVEKPLWNFTNIHIGLSYLASVARERGHTTRLVVLCSEMVRTACRLVDRVMAEYDPHMICFTAVSTQYPFILRMADYIRSRWPGKLLVIGGMHVSLNPGDEMLNTFDALCVGEGEFSVTELAGQREAGKTPSGIPNLWIRHSDGTIEKNQTRKFLQDLDALPFPDREMWRPWIQDVAGERHVILLGRGCPFGCTYCSNHAIRKLAPGKYVRFRSPSNIIREIAQLREQWPDVRDIYFQIETICLDKKWLLELSRRLKQFNQGLSRPIEYGCNFRVAGPYINEETFSALEQAGIKTLEIGLESGSERIRKDVLGRNYTNEEFLRSVALAHAHGMKVNVYNMIGIPGETVEDHMETVHLNRLCCPERSNTSIFFPYPGTDLFRRCAEQGLLKTSPYDGLERRRAVLSLPGFSKREIQHAYDWFEYRIYKGKKPFWLRLRKVIRNKIGACFVFHYFFLKLLPVWHRLHPFDSRP
jgi:anaerobic magnesium-protoporphyrin IX monomethyl ester cyclase